MGSGESRPRCRAACAKTSCCNSRRRHHRSRRAKTNDPCYYCYPECCPTYPEFTLSTSGICYVQCDFCCQIYPCCCAQCPNCGCTRVKCKSKEVEIPPIAFCPCCRQEAPKANGLQHLYTPNPCCACQCASADQEQIAKCLLRSYKLSRGKGRKCCQCKQRKREKRGTQNRERSKSKSKSLHYPAEQKAHPSTCKPGTSAACCSPPQRADNCCCERSKASVPPIAANLKDSAIQTQQKQSQCAPAPSSKVECQRSVETSSPSSKARKIPRTANNPSQLCCPCGREVEIRNITYELPVCRADDGSGRRQQ
ncbi:keratin-associated protein 9-1-like [Bactrocera neohumeralis]|uniref:keratin-associated protein 9-1-like n=1 Tax=Bactrocera neohumeralis TaxID=98809 RepID=UPI0021656BBC|nr:keratin-associated protein 9-1-like [Bactrocera neohumeralis]